MLLRDKKYYRGPVLEAAKGGTIPHSIDSRLRGMPVVVDPWDAITILGAQLCRPPYDAYRERVDTSLGIGTDKNKLTLGSPVLLGTENGVSSAAYTIVHDALEALGGQGSIYAVISPFVPAKYQISRNYAVILRENGANESDRNFADAFSTQHDPEKIKQLQAYGKPVLVYTQNPGEVPYVLDTGADAIIFVLPPGSLEQLKAIIAAKQQFADYFRGTDIDRKLVFANGINDSGRLMKAIAMGAVSAHGAVYDIPILINTTLKKLAGSNGEYSRDLSKIVENLLLGTHVEITQLSGAPGYSRYDNLSHDDLRTSDPEVSLVTGIAMEGLNVTWFDWHKAILEAELREQGVVIDNATLEAKVLKLIEICR